MICLKNLVIKYDVEKQHAKNKYHAAERIALLVDKGSFREIGSQMNQMNYSDEEEEKNAPYDGVITGKAKIGGKTVYIFSQDFTVRAGTLGRIHGQKIANLISKAIEARCPLIGIYDSGGARIDEGIHALAGCGEMMHYNSLASGVIPQISIVVGPCAGAAAYSPALTDFVFIVNNVGCMFITGSEVAMKVTGEKTTNQELGGAKVHGEKTGVAHFFEKNEKVCFEEVKNLVSMLPSSWDDNTYHDTYNLSYQGKDGKNIKSIIPEDTNKPYDMKDIILEVVDDKSFLEVSKDFAQSVVVGFAKVSGVTVGIIANQPIYNSGVLDCDSSDKAARMVRFCDCFQIPILTLVDTPGYLPGTDQEHAGIIRHGAKLLYAYSEATVPKVTVIIRRAYGGAYIAMGSHHLGTDYVYAFQSAQIAVMGAEGATSVLYRRAASKIEDSDEKDAFLEKKTTEYKEKYMNPRIAVKAGYVDEIISPEHVRQRIFEDFVALRNKTQHRPEKKHGNMPL